MSTARAVGDGPRISDEQLGRFARRIDDLKRRMSQGTLDFARVMNQLQLISENHFPTLGRLWRKENDEIYLSVTSSRVTGIEWVERFRKAKVVLHRYVEKALRAPDFVPKKGTIYEIGIVNGASYMDHARRLSSIRSGATFRTPKLADLKVEAAFLLHESLTGDDLESMGFDRIVIVHKPIEEPDGDTYYLCVERDDSCRGVGLGFRYDGNPGFTGFLDRKTGFAFCVIHDD